MIIALLSGKFCSFGGDPHCDCDPLHAKFSQPCLDCTQVPVMHPAEWTGGSDLYLRFVPFALLMLTTAAQAPPLTTAHFPMHIVALLRHTHGPFFPNAAFACSASL